MRSLIRLAALTLLVSSAALADDATDIPIIVYDNNGDMVLAYAHVHIDGPTPLVCFTKDDDVTPISCLVPKGDGTVVLISPQHEKPT